MSTTTVPHNPAEAAELVLDHVPRITTYALPHGQAVAALTHGLGCTLGEAQAILHRALHEPVRELISLWSNTGPTTHLLVATELGQVRESLTTLDAHPDLREFLVVTTDGRLVARTEPYGTVARAQQWITTRTAITAATPAIAAAADRYRHGEPAPQPRVPITDTVATALILTLLPNLHRSPERVDTVVRTVDEYLRIGHVRAHEVVNLAAGDPAPDPSDPVGDHAVRRSLLRLRVTDDGSARPVSHAERGFAHAVVSLADAGYSAGHDGRLTIVPSGRLRPTPNPAAVPGTDWLVFRPLLTAALDGLR